MKKLLIIITILLITGCSHPDINKESIVTSLYIDDKLTCFYIVPDERDSYLTSIQGNGETLYEMFNDIKNKSSKKLYFNHLTTIVISEKITYHTLMTFLETINIHDNVNIIIAQDINTIMTEYIELAPFETISTTLNSKNIKLTNYKTLKENPDSFIPLVTYNNGTTFMGYKKIQP